MMTDTICGNRWRGYVGGMLRGAAQVMLQDGIATGILFCAGLLWACYGPGASASVVVAWGGLAGLAASTATGYLWGKAEAADRGLYGFNGMLCGCALATLTDCGIWLWAMVAMVGVLVVPLQCRCERLARRFGVPAYTSPFIIAVWVSLIICRAVGVPE